MDNTNAWIAPVNSEVMRRVPPTFSVLLLGLSLGAKVSATAAPPPVIAPFLDAHCSGCHDAADKKGGLDLDALKFDSDPANHAKWVQIFDRVLSGEMPPPKKQRPDPKVQRTFLTTLGQGLLQQHVAAKGTVLRRLNRTEYENTIRDLLGVHVSVRDLLPEDSLSHGFDNIGEALSISEMQLGRYLEAAEFALNTTLQRTSKPENKKVLCDYAKESKESKTWESKLLRPDGAVVFFNDGGYPSGDLKDFRAPITGKYRVNVSGYGYQAKVPVVFGLYSANGSAGAGSAFFGNLSLPPDTLETRSMEVWLRAGENVKIAPRLSMNYNEMKKGPAAYPFPGLALMPVEVEGPVLESWPPQGMQLLFGDLVKEDRAGDDKKFNGASTKLRAIFQVTSSNPSADAERLLRNFAGAAFRRPLDAPKIAPYLALFEEEFKRSSSFAIAMRTAAVAILCSPDFLYLKEPAGKLDDYALAARLSYFLTRTMPDEELARVAASGKMREPQALRKQTERLLNSPSAVRFTEDFTNAWLNLRAIDNTSPDKKLYPEFDEELQSSMVAESRAYFEELLRSNLDPANIVKSSFAMLNQRLAEHYCVPGVSGLEIRKVSLPPESKRGGVLTQAAVLKVSANGTNTSPVIRGAWVLERILGVTPPPPPPGVPGVEPDIRGATTLREQLEKHRQLETCNGCHRVLDPPGFALENYDVIGGWREKFRTLEKGTSVSQEVNGRKVNFRVGPPVDASGKLVEGGDFNGLAQYQDLLMQKPERVTKAITEKFLTFASGRELGFSDRNEVTAISEELRKKKGGMRDLVHLVVSSSIFQSK